MSVPQRVALLLGAVLVVVGVVVAMGGDSPAGDAVDPKWLGDSPSGSVRYCSGPDVSETQRRSVRDFNKSTASAKATAVAAFDFPDDADGQRAAYRQAMRDGTCDVVYMDVAYMPEFASDELLYEMGPYLSDEDREDTFDDQMLQTAEYDKRLWGVPKQLDGGVLFYRSDKVTSPPASWQEVFRDSIPLRQAGSGGTPRAGLRLPLEMYEGLTVVVLELAYAADAEPIVDGDVANVDQPEVLEALKALRDAIDTGAVPRTGVDSKERGTLGVFRRGRALYLRNWVFAEARIAKEVGASERLRRIADVVDVVPLPPWEGGSRVGILGGHDLVIPRSAKNPEGALHLVEFLTSREQLTRDARAGSLAPPLAGWRTEDVVENSDALNALAATQLELRPQIPRWADVSSVIGNTVSNLLDLRGTRSPSDATLEDKLDDIQRRVQEILSGT